MSKSDVGDRASTCEMLRVHRAPGPVSRGFCDHSPPGKGGEFPSPCIMNDRPFRTLSRLRRTPALIICFLTVSHQELVYYSQTKLSARLDTPSAPFNCPPPRGPAIMRLGSGSLQHSWDSCSLGAEKLSPVCLELVMCHDCCFSGF